MISTLKMTVEGLNISIIVTVRRACEQGKKGTTKGEPDRQTGSFRDFHTFETSNQISDIREHHCIIGRGSQCCEAEDIG